MLSRTKPFNFDNTHEIITGVEVPSNGVNLTHHYSSPLVPDENIVVGDNSGFINKNTTSQEQIMYAGEDYILRHIISDNEIVESELVEITDKFFGDTPLYYCYKLKHLFYGETNLLSGAYFGKSIAIEDYYGNNIPNSYKYIIYLEKPNLKELNIDTEKYMLSQVYEVYIYTSFQIQNNYRIRCKYNAMYKDVNGYKIIPNYTEAINPQSFFKKVNNVLDTIEEKNKYHMMKSSKEIRSSVLSIGSIIEDPRTPQKIRVKVDVTFLDGTTASIYFPEKEGEYIELYNSKCAIDSEEDLFEDGKQIISPFNINTYFDRKDIVSVVPLVADIDRGQQNVEFYVRPDRDGKLYAATSLEQKKIEGSLIKKLLKKDKNIVTCYSVRMKDRKPIKILKPREVGSNSAWYIRIQNGKFTILDGTSTYHYFVPEYYSQVFHKEYGYPYRSVVKEVPEIIGERSIRLKCAPLFVNKDADLYVRKIYDDGVVIDLNIESWNTNDGVINLEECININDNIYVDYVYEEGSFIYTGYIDTANTTSNIYLDCNPNKHHYVSTIIDGEIIDVPTFSLLDKKIYVYIAPAVSIVNGKKTFNQSVIRHSFEPLSAAEIDSYKLQLIGVVYIRPNSSYYSLALEDSRSRGGGLIETISDELRKILEPESDFYWDIGYWDGEPFNNTGTVIIKLDKKLLIENGGNFTKEDIENSIHKHLAFGTFAIIEYVNVITKEDISIKNLEISQ